MRHIIIPMYNSVKSQLLWLRPNSYNQYKSVSHIDEMLYIHFYEITRSLRINCHVCEDKQHTLRVTLLSLSKILWYLEYYHSDPTVITNIKECHIYINCYIFVFVKQPEVFEWTVNKIILGVPHYYTKYIFISFCWFLSNFFGTHILPWSIYKVNGPYFVIKSKRLRFRHIVLLYYP